MRQQLAKITVPLALVGLSASILPALAEQEVFRDRFEDLTPPPEITHFEVLPNQVVQGAPVTVSWSSENAEYCERSGSGFPGWQGLTGPNGQVVLSSGAADPMEYFLVLTCFGAGGLDSRELMLRIFEQTAPGPSDCGGRMPPPHLVRATECLIGSSADCLDYEAVFGPFPGTPNSRRIRLQQNQYAAMAFTPDQSLPSTWQGHLTAEYDQLGGVSGSFLWSISACLGDFDQAAIEADSGPNCYGQWRFGLDAIHFGGPDSSGFRNCRLEPGQLYFLNLLPTSQPPGTPPQQLNWFCDGASACAWLMRVGSR